MEPRGPISSLLPIEDKHTEHRLLCGRCEGDLTGQSYRAFSKWKLLLVFELCQMLIIFVFFGVFAFQWQIPTSVTPKKQMLYSLSNYANFQDYNTTEIDFGIHNAADASHEATQFWREITASDGLIAIDSQKIRNQELPPTVPHPTEKGLNLYQIQGFHSLHCLYRIRNRLLSEVPLEKWPRNDFHTMHCVDHIREDLMCNLDLMLRGSKDYIVFDTTSSHGRQCRDFGATHAWALDHKWEGYTKYIHEALHADPAEVEVEVHRQKVELESKLGRKIGYDEIKVEINPNSGEVELSIESHRVT